MVKILRGRPGVSFTLAYTVEYNDALRSTVSADEVQRARITIGIACVRFIWVYI